MVRVDASHSVELATLGSVLMKVTSQEVLVLMVTLKVVLLVISVRSVVDVAFASVLVYSCPLTAEPLLPPHALSLKSCADSVPFSGAPWAAVMVAVSLGSQFWAEAVVVVSVTVKHSPEVRD